MDTPHSTFRVSEPFAQLSRKLSAAKLYWHALRAAESLLGFTALAGGWLLFLFAADTLLKPSPAARLVLMGVAAAVLLVALLYFLICAWRRVSDMDVAMRVEAKNPHLDERLLAALELQRGQFDPRGLSDALVQATIHEGTDAALQVDFRKVFDTTRVKRRGAAALATGGAWGLMVLFASAALGEGFRHYRSAYAEWLWQRYGNVTVAPGNRVVLKGADVDIEAQVKGGEAQEVVAQFGKLRYPMQRSDEPNKFRYELSDLKQSLTYRVIADNHVSPQYKVEVVDAPRVTNLQIEYRYPDYTGWSPQYVENSDGNIKALRGTQVTIVATTNRAVKTAEFRVQGSGFSDEIPMTVSDGKTLRTDLTLTQAGTYTIHLRDQYGFEDARRKTYEIQVLPDKLPTVSVLSPKNIAALPEALIPVTVRAADDFGVSKLTVNTQHAIRNTQLYDPPHPSPSETFALNLKQMKAKPGDVITYFAQAYDNDTVDGPKSAHSPVYKIKVLSVANFLEELKKYQREMGRVLNHLYNKQLGLLHKNQNLMQQLQSGEQVSSESLRRLSQEQHDLAQQAQKLAQDIQRRQEQAHLSNLATPFENVEQRLESIAKDLMEQAAQNLSKAQQQKGGQQQSQKGNMQKAEQQQKDAADALNTMKEGLENLDREKQLLEMVQKAMAMRTEQEAISQNLQNASPQQMQQQSNKQQNLSKQAQQLAQQAQEAAKKYQKEDPITAQRLEDVPNLMERSQLQQSMKQSSQAMQNQNPQQARENSQKAEESLKDLEEYLKRTYQDAQLNRARKERDYLGKMLFQVEKLIREQSQVIEGTKKLSERMRDEGLGMKDTTRHPSPDTPPPPPDFGNPPMQNDARRTPQPSRERQQANLAQQQGNIAQQTEGLTDDLRWLMKAMPQLKLSSPSVARDAAQPMKEAMGKLQKKQPKEALPKEQQGKSELDKIAQALRDAFSQQQGGGSQRTGQGQQQALNLAALQEGINDRTKQLHQKQQRGKLSPSEQLELEQMARQEEFIRQAITQARNLFGGAWSPDTRSIIDQARKDLRDVESALPQQQTGKETQEKQHDILAALLRLGNEMSGQPQSGGEQPQEGMPVTFGGMQPMQPQPAQSQPNSMDGRLTEHGPAMKFVPETLKAHRGLTPGSDAAARQPSAVNKPTKRGVEGRALPQYEKATGDYFKKIGK
jgi:hypothetical protein